MGLDDFTEESLSDEEKDRRKELSQNSPPDDSSNWRQHEPGRPDWLSFISGKEVENKSEILANLQEGTDQMWGETVLIVNTDGVDSTTLRSTNYIELDEVR